MTNERNEPSLDIVGIGNAIVDVLTKTDDSLLERLSFHKGSMTLIDEKKAKAKVEEMCKKLLANLVIEDYKIL